MFGYPTISLGWSPRSDKRAKVQKKLSVLLAAKVSGTITPLIKNTHFVAHSKKVKIVNATYLFKFWTLDKKKLFASMMTLLANSCSSNFWREWLRYFKGFGMAMPAAGCANAIRQQSRMIREPRNQTSEITPVIFRS